MKKKVIFIGLIVALGIVNQAAAQCGHYFHPYWGSPRFFVAPAPIYVAPPVYASVPPVLVAPVPPVLLPPLVVGPRFGVIRGGRWGRW